MVEHEPDRPLNGQADVESVASAITLAHDASPALPVEPATVEVEEAAAAQADDSASFSRLTPGAIFFGVLISVGLIAFVLLARITVHPFDQIDRKMRVIDVWRRLRHHLPDVAHPALLGIIYDLSIALIVIGSLACIWLALMAMTPQEPPQLDESVDQASPPDVSVLQTGR